VYAVRIATGVLLFAGSACEDTKQAEDAIEHAEHEAEHAAAQKEAEATCVEVFAKVASCRDDMLLLARTGPVLRGDPPEVAFTAAKRLEQSMSTELEAECAKGVPKSLAKGVECYRQECRAVASCMMEQFEYPAPAEGGDALRCRDGLPALEAKAEGKVLQWCVMPDGTPHGLFKIVDAAGTLLVEGIYDRGHLRRDGVAPTPGKKWWDG
jgi:hypothetical protein